MGQTLVTIDEWPLIEANATAITALNDAAVSHAAFLSGLPLFEQRPDGVDTVIHLFGIADRFAFQARADDDPRSAMVRSFLDRCLDRPSAMPDELFVILSTMLRGSSMKFTEDHGNEYVNYRLQFTSTGIAGAFYTYELNAKKNEYEPTTDGTIGKPKPVASPESTTGASATPIKTLTPSPALAAIVGAEPQDRAEITKKLWAYIKEHSLTDPVNKRQIRADEKLKVLFGGKSSVSMFDLTKIISQHVA